MEGAKPAALPKSIPLKAAPQPAPVLSAAALFRTPGELCCCDQERAPNIPPTVPQPKEECGTQWFDAQDCIGAEWRAGNEVLETAGVAQRKR